jgi:hypothetical protein
MATRAMAEAGCFTAEEIERVRTLILATEPMQRRKVAMAYQAAEDGSLEEVAPVVGLPGELARLGTDPALARMAGNLSDGDLFSSVGLGVEENARQTRLVFQESGQDGQVDPAKVAFFLNHIVGEGFASRAGAGFLFSLGEIRRQSLGTATTEVLHAAITPAGPEVHGPLHPDAMEKLRQLVTAMSEGGRALGIEPRAGGGFTLLAKDGRLEVCPSGVIAHKNMVSGRWTLGDDVERGIPAVTAFSVKPDFASGPGKFLTDPHGICQVIERHVVDGGCGAEAPRPTA